MRFRALTAVSALTALTLIGMVPVAQAAGPSAPAAGGGPTFESSVPDVARAMDAARVEGTPSIADATQWRQVCFQAHSRSAGWTSTVCSDEPGFTGTEGHNDPIDGLRFWVNKVADMDFNVQVHWANDGSGWEYHVPPGGSIELDNGNGNVVEAIHLRSSNEPMKAAAHVKNVGWKGTNLFAYDQWIGSIGENRWMEAFWIDI
ncbi:hypothetical protein ACFVUH_02470 [Kitasatospora sp. NPDC058032]|uniref:hypothetical protein n=1 Tax=Kitasatospora sp. NPDC058032 TaxID=3346307 RepID=UPI0036DDD1B0